MSSPTVAKGCLMSRSVKYQLWIAVAAGLISFTNLGGAGLFDMDEALYATCAREMLDRGNVVVPWFNGEMFPEKPPLMLWNMMCGFKLFGTNEFGARFLSAVFGIGTALVAFHLAKTFFNLRTALWAGIVTASTVIFTISARAATVDSALTFFTAMAFLMFVTGWRKSTEAGNQKANDDTASKPTWRLSHRFPLRYAVASYACIGVAVLGKGPVGVALPLAAMGLFLLTINGWRTFFRCAWWMRPFTIVIVIAAVAGPWYVEVGRETHGEWLRQFLLEFNLRPFSQPIQGHGDTSSMSRLLATLVSFLLYFIQIPFVLAGFFPWSVFLGPTAVDAMRRLREGRAVANPDEQAVRSREGVLLALCWFGVWLVLWSICKTKLPHYLLPAYPALAILTAAFLEKGSEQFSAGPSRETLPAWGFRNAWISTILVGAGIVIAIPIAAAKFLPGEGPLGLLGLLLVFGGAWCWWKTAHGRYYDALFAFTLMSIVFLTAVFGFGTLRVDRHQNAKPMMAAICADEKSDTRPRSPIATYCFFRESTVFYGGKPVTRCDIGRPAGCTGPQSLAKFFEKHPGRSYVITTGEHLAELEKAFRGQLTIIYREPQFLGDGQIIVFRRGE